MKGHALSLLYFFLLSTYLPALSYPSPKLDIDTLPDGRAVYELSPDELVLFSDPDTRAFVTGTDQDIQLNIRERLYLFGTMLTVSSPTLKPIAIARALPGLTKVETGITQSAKKIMRAHDFKKGLAAMEAGENSEVIIDGIKVVFQSDGPFSGFTLFGENGFVIGKEALKSSDEIAKTVLHECYRLATSTTRSDTGVSQGLLTQETENVVNFVERAFKTIRP